MSPKLKKAIMYIIPPVVTVGLCYVLYSGIDLARVLADARMCDPLLVTAFLACNVLAMVLRGYRWRLQLRAIGVNPGVGVMSRSIFGTYAVNLVFPRLGEFWRCAYVARVSSTPFSGVFGTMVADRLSDTLMVGLICAATFVVCSGAMTRFMDRADVPTDALTSWPVLCALVVLVLAALFFIFSKSAPARKVRAFCLKTWQGFMVIFHMPRRLQWLLLTLGIWGSYILSMALSLLAFPPTAALVATHGFPVILVTFVFGSLAMAIPSNGGIGPWQLAIILSLTGLYALPQPQALTFATINLGATTLLTILLGLYTFARLSLKSR